MFRFYVVINRFTVGKYICLKNFLDFIIPRYNTKFTYYSGSNFRFAKYYFYIAASIPFMNLVLLKDIIIS